MEHLSTFFIIGVKGQQVWGPLEYSFALFDFHIASDKTYFHIGHIKNWTVVY